ncbi:hypothetical protein ADK58_04700 [Streptomyces sp. XY152]|nr:hypothetical protein ADK58_04700 [Streptomyces sp. XY152]
MVGRFIRRAAPEVLSCVQRAEAALADQPRWGWAPARQSPICWRIFGWMSYWSRSAGWTKRTPSASSLIVGAPPTGRPRHVFSCCWRISPPLWATMWFGLV